MDWIIEYKPPQNHIYFIQLFQEYAVFVDGDLTYQLYLHQQVLLYQHQLLQDKLLQDSRFHLILKDHMIFTYSNDKHSCLV